jgi:hypothetical protein
MSEEKLGRAWEHGIINLEEVPKLDYFDLCRGLRKGEPLEFPTSFDGLPFLPIQIEILGRRKSDEEFDITGTMENEDWSYRVKGWYNVETGLGHLVLRQIYA